MLGAGGLQTFFRVTLPNIKWGLLYGVILCNARAMGEFGAVSVVSGQIRGADQHAAAARRDSLQRIQLPGGVCRRVAAGVAGAGDARAQDDRRSDGVGRSRVAEAGRRSRSRRIGMGIEVSNVSKTFGSFVALDDVSFSVPSGRARRAARPVGLRQDDAAADHRGARGGRLGHRAARRRGRHASAARAIAASASCSSTTRCSGT